MLATWVLIWTLVWGVATCYGQSLERPAPTQSAIEHVVLTAEHPEGSFAVAPEVLASPPALLALTMIRVVNPANTPVEFQIYLACRPGSKPGAAPVKIPLGTVALYPPDRAAAFRLRASTAFRRLRTAMSEPADVRLVVEMKRIHEEIPWSPIKVTLAPPKWESEAGR